VQLNVPILVELISETGNSEKTAVIVLLKRQIGLFSRSSRVFGENTDVHNSGIFEWGFI
jgi:hypothetical protein